LDAAFDVFLSHNGLDKPVVERIAEYLRREGLRPFLDIWDLTPGGRWQRELAEGLARSTTCALFIGPHALGEWQLEELELALVRANRRDDFRVFPVLLPGVADPFDAEQLPPFVSTRTWVDLRAGVSSRRAMQTLMNAIKGVASGSAAPAVALTGVAPYRGLEPFHERDAEMFFGREREVQRLLELLKSTPLLCVVGPSGSGKSSLVRAGLLPRLRDGALPEVEGWTISVMRPGAHPLEALAGELVRLGAGTSMRATIDDLTSDRQTLHLGVAQALGADAPRRRVLIVVDQLEEAFTLCSDERERSQFFANLLHAAFASGGRTVVVATMRADFYARCAEYPELAQRSARALALVGPMDADELRQAIEEPARRVGLFFESGLVETILDDVGADPGALPLLEHALLEIWRRRVGDQLTLDGYVEAGRVEGALAKRAEAIFASLTPEQQQVARRMMLRLTQPGEGTADTRRRARIEELASRDRQAFDVALSELVDARLLTTSGSERDGDATVEVSHEALTRGWPRLRGWIDAAGRDLVVHRRLTEAEAEWARLGQDDGVLYRGAALAEALALSQRDPDALNDREREFLATSAAREDDARRRELEGARNLAAAQRRAKRGLVAVVAVLLAGVAAATSLAMAAFAARDEAGQERDRVLSAQLATAALDQAETDPELALVLANEAASLTEHSPQAEDALRRALASPLRFVLRGREAPIEMLEFSPDGRFVATSTAADDVHVWDLAQARRRTAIDPRLGALQAIALSEGGRLMLVAGARGVAVWDLAAGGSPSRLPEPGLEASECAFTASGRRAACVGEREATIWDVAGRRLLARPTVPGPGGSALSRNGEVVALATPRGAIRLFSVSRAVPTASLPGRGRPLTTVQLDATGSRVLTRSDDGRVVVRDAVRDATLLRQTLPTETKLVMAPSGQILVADDSEGAAHEDRVFDLKTAAGTRMPIDPYDPPLFHPRSFAADGRTIVGVVAGEAVVLDLANGRALARLRPPGSQSVAIAQYAPGGGDRLLTTDQAGAITVWSPGVVALARRGGGAVGAAFSPDGKVLAAADGQALRLWRPDSGQPLGQGEAIPARGGADRDLALAFSHDGERLRVDAADGRMHDVAVHRGIDRSRRARGTSQSIAATGSYVALTEHETVAEVRRAGTDEPALRVDPRADGGGRVEIVGASLSRSGRRLALALDDGASEVWDVERGDLIFRHRVGGKGVSAIALRPDGRKLAAIDSDGALWIVDVGTKHERKLAGAVTDHDYGLSISPDGRLLVVRGATGSTLYDAGTGRVVQKFAGREAFVAVDPSSSRVAIEMAGGPVFVRRCDECGSWNDLRARAQRRVQRQLTNEERVRALEGEL